MSSFHFTTYSWMLLASGGISLTLAILCLSRRNERLAFLLGLALLAEAWWSILVGVSTASIPLSQKLVFTKMSYAGVYYSVPIFLLFAMEYAGLGKWITRRNILLIAIIPTAIILLAATNEAHHLIWSGFIPLVDGSENEYIFLRGPAYWLGVVNNYAALLAMTILFIHKVRRTRFSLYRWQSILVAAGIVPVWLANFIYVIALDETKGYDFTPIAFALTGIMLFVGILRFQLLNLSPIAREAVFERIKDGIVVLDKYRRVVDVNHAGKNYLCTHPAAAIGKPASHGLSAYPAVLAALYSEDTASLEKPILIKSSNHHHNRSSAALESEICLSQLTDDAGNRLGYLVMFRDVSAQKRAELLEREQRLLAESLSQAALTFTKTLDVEETLNRILDEVAAILPNQLACIQMVDDHGSASIMGFRGQADPETAEWMKTTRPEVAKTPGLSWMADTGQALIIPDLLEPGESGNMLKFGRSYLGAPVRVKDNVIGFINLCHEQPNFYTPTHLKKLQAFADLAAVVIENTRLFQMTQELANTDGLTSVNNRRYFFVLAIKEVRRSIRFKKDLSLLMMDLDYFKEINDTYGHQVGDSVLKHLGELFRTALREVDIPGRYGGDEFAIILPETSEQNAVIMGNRLLELIRESEIPTEAGPIRFTASFGLSSLDDHHGSFEDLLQEADRALYLAKQKGRNRLEIYTQPEPVIR